MRGGSSVDDTKFKELSEKFDKLSKILVGNQRQVAYMDNQEGYQEGNQGNYQEYENEDVVERQEEINYVGNQGGYNNYKPFNNTHPNLSYRSPNVENPQDQVYPQASNQGQAFQPRPYNNTSQARPQQGFNQQPRPNFAPNFQQGYQPRGTNFQPQANTSNRPTQDVDFHAMFQSIMEGQTRNQQETDKKFMVIHAQINQVNSRLDSLESQVAQVTTHVKTLDNQVAQLASSSQRTTGTLPGKSVTNPKSPCNVILQSEGDEKSVKAITLRSGKKLISKEGSNIENGEAIEIEPCVEMATDKVKEPLDESFRAMEKATYVPPPYEPKVPFPRRVYTKKEKSVLSQFKKDLRQLEITLPMNDRLDQVPTQMKFIKSILANKEKLEELMQVIEAPKVPPLKTPPISKTLVKKEHPGKFVIPCSIGGVKFDDALCDSGAFVNVISLSLVQEMGLKGMKPNSTPLVFGDASKKTPKGIIEDYPILVGNCIVPTDFLVLDMVDSKKQPLILGAPFLTTVGAIIDYVKKVVVLKNVDDTVSYAMEPPIDSVVQL